uniref:Uncharacterized protein n=1 Tax=Helianthus annuus TaxID=4232 RepID=A0A251VBA8_HELAN
MHFSASLHPNSSSRERQNFDRNWAESFAEKGVLGIAPALAYIVFGVVTRLSPASVFIVAGW